MTRTHILMGGALAAALIATSLLTGAALAHVSLADPKAAPGAYYTSFFRVGHGCAGSATTALRIEIPEGIVMARPQPKPGWTVSIEHVPLATPAMGEGGKPVTERVSAIVWRGGPLPDAQWDQFGFMAKLPATPGKLYFPTVQTCESGEARWTETAAAPGQPLSHPAPVLDVETGAGGNDMAGMDMRGMAMGDAGASRPLGAATPAKPAHTPRPGKAGVVVEGAWIAAAPAGAPTAAGYLTLRNTGNAMDSFLGGSTPVADALEIHSMSMAGGVMRMRPVEGGLPLPAGQAVSLAPAGGHHLMLAGLKHGLRPGDKVKAVLRFAKAGDIAVIFSVRAR